MNKEDFVMMKNEMLQNIEYLREKANVSYEEAMELLHNNNDDVMRVLIELEKQGRMQDPPEGDDKQSGCHEQRREVKDSAASLFNRAKNTRLIIEKMNRHGEKEMIANISALAVVGITIFAPHFTFAAVVLTLVTGHQVKVAKRDC